MEDMDHMEDMEDFEGLSDGKVALLKLHLHIRTVANLIFFKKC